MMTLMLPKMDLLSKAGLFIPKFAKVKLHKNVLLAKVQIRN